MSARSLALTAAAGVLLTAACSADDQAASTASAAQETSTDAEVVDIALFDSDVVHEIAIDYDEAEYDAMIDEFSETREKTWIEATVTVDGETYEQVGLRLKGNSSLGGLGGGFGPRPDVAQDDARDGEDELPAPAPDDAGGPGGIGSASADEPESLPWLIRLDEFVEGQDHQGYEDIVVRSNGSETSLNEAVALDLLEQAALPSQEAAATRLSVNGGEEVLRLAIEHPDDDAWQEANFDDDGALYKAESTGDWSYRGTDPANYEEVFDQEGGTDLTDLTPLIEFLEFINESDDETFSEDLGSWLDVDAFARYLAMMELLGNFDDIDGPGNNAYLWYDLGSGQFTVVPWDMNLVFGGLGGGGFGPPGGADPEDLPEDFQPPEGFDPEQLPDDFQPPDGFDPEQLPEGFEPPEGGPGGGGFGGRSNPLVERFLEDEDFAALYDAQLDSLRASIYGDEVADQVLERWVDTLTKGASDLVDEETIRSEADAIADQFVTE